MRRGEGVRNARVDGEKAGEGGNERGKKRRKPLRVGSHLMSKILQKYPDCRTDLIGGAAIGLPTFAPDGNHSRAATGLTAVLKLVLRYEITITLYFTSSDCSSGRLVSLR